MKRKKVIIVFIVIGMISIIIFSAVKLRKELYNPKYETLLPKEMQQETEYNGYTIKMIQCDYDQHIQAGQCIFEIFRTDTSSKGLEVNKDNVVFGEKEDMYFSLSIAAGSVYRTTEYDEKNNKLYYIIDFNANFWENSDSAEVVKLYKASDKNAGEQKIGEFQLAYAAESVVKFSLDDNESIKITENGCFGEHIGMDGIYEFIIEFTDGTQLALVEDRKKMGNAVFGGATKEYPIFRCEFDKKVNTQQIRSINFNGKHYQPVG